MNTVESKEFAARLKDPNESLSQSTERLNKWLSQNNDCAVINIETIYGRCGERRAHYDGEEIGIVGLRLWYFKPQAT